MNFKFFFKNSGFDEHITPSLPIYPVIFTSELHGFVTLLKKNNNNKEMSLQSSWQKLLFMLWPIFTRII